MFTVTQNVGGGASQTTYKAFNWDQSYRKAILYTAAPDDKQNTPLWRVDDPLKTVAPIVASELQQQLAPPPPPPAAPTTQPGQPVTTTPTSTSSTTPPPRRRRWRSCQERSTTRPTIRISQWSTTA